MYHTNPIILGPLSLVKVLLLPSYGNNLWNHLLWYSAPVFHLYPWSPLAVPISTQQKAPQNSPRLGYILTHINKREIMGIVKKGEQCWGFPTLLYDAHIKRRHTCSRAPGSLEWKRPPRSPMTSGKPGLCLLAYLHNTGRWKHAKCLLLIWED